jgi:hypothetical protein
MKYSQTSNINLDGIVSSFLGNGDLFEDILRHGCQDIFWCYAYEREV